MRAAPPIGERVDFANAYYIKLGTGGEWAKSSIENNLMRLGWAGQTLDEINTKNWEKIEADLKRERARLHNKPDRGAVTRDLRMLQMIGNSSPADVWITFYRSHLWWCRVEGTPVEADTVSKFRRVTGWSNQDIHGKSLPVSDIPGFISQLQGFRGTVCTVRDRDALVRLINDQPSDAYRETSGTKALLSGQVAGAIKTLHPKDFEILVDLVFRNAGWRRISEVGGLMEGGDLLLEEPITGHRYEVQVKSRSSVAEYGRYVDEFAGRGCKKLFYVVHTDEGLAEARNTDTVELVLADRLGHMVVNAGLVDWVLNRIR